MAQRQLKTYVIDCEGPGCDAVFADVVELSLGTVLHLARQAGWQIGMNRDLCPACKLLAETPTREKIGA